MQSAEPIQENRIMINEVGTEISSTFSTNFSLDEKDIPQLGIHNDGHINRTLIGRDAVGKTSFNAVLDRVQYGTYDGQPACLIVAEFSFRFKGKTMSRYSYASIEVKFTRAVDVKDHKDASNDPADDPKVVNLAPKEVYGIVKSVEEKRFRDVKIPAMFQSPLGFSTGAEGHIGSEEIQHQEHRMEIHGDLYYDDEHIEAACGATWDLSENSAQRDGIFRNFRATMVLHNPPGQAIWMHLTVRPSVRFSINPQRLFLKTDLFARLLQQNDEPILLDGKSPKGKGVGLGVDFSSPGFPWREVVWLPVEYKVLCRSVICINPPVCSRPYSLKCYFSLRQLKMQTLVHKTKTIRHNSVSVFAVSNCDPLSRMPSTQQAWSPASYSKVLAW
jgi:hypothetical protein